MQLPQVTRLESTEHYAIGVTLKHLSGQPLDLHHIATAIHRMHPPTQQLGRALKAAEYADDPTVAEVRRNKAHLHAAACGRRLCRPGPLTRNKQCTEQQPTKADSGCVSISRHRISLRDRSADDCANLHLTA